MVLKWSTFKFISSDPNLHPRWLYPWQKLTWPMARWAKNQPIRNKSRLWWPCLLTDRNVISNLYRGPSIDASYQVLVHLAKRFQRRRFLRWLISSRSVNKHGRHRPFLFLIGWFLKKSSLKPLSQMNLNLVGNIYGRSSIQIAHFVQKQEWPVAAIFVNGSGRNEQYL
jgi:hypothetical protein